MKPHQGREYPHFSLKIAGGAMILLILIIGIYSIHHNKKEKERELYLLGLSTFMGGSSIDYYEHTYWEFNDFTIWDMPKKPNLDSLMAKWIVNALIEEPAIADKIYVNGELIYEK